ncbi:MAG: sigma-70 family RNA polymerase sigma factor, partial [Treponemataceae bacterium]
MGNQRFDALWNDYYSRIKYYVSHSFPSLRGEAGDLTQETFTRAFASLESLDAERSPAPWLYSVARN